MTADRNGVAHIQVARSVLLAEIYRIEHAASAHAGALIRIPVHGVRVGVAGMESQAATAIARKPKYRRLIS